MEETMEVPRLIWSFAYNFIRKSWRETRVFFRSYQMGHFPLCFPSQYWNDSNTPSSENDLNCMDTQQT